MSTTKSRRRRLLLLLGAFLLLAGGATATTLALRPHARPVAAPRRVTTTTTVRTVSYPAVALPSDVNDGVQPVPGGPDCSPGGATCIAAESNPRTGGTHFAMSVDHGKTWVPGYLPGRQVPLGSYRQWGYVQAACVRGVCMVVRSADTRGEPDSKSAIWTCTALGGVAKCTRHNVPPTKSPFVAGVACPGPSTCFATGTPAGEMGETTGLALWEVNPETGQVGALAGRFAPAETNNSCQQRAHRARQICVNDGLPVFGGIEIGLRCSPAGCDTDVGQNEIAWRHPEAGNPVAPVDTIVRDTALGGAHLPAPIGVRVTGPTSGGLATCPEATWCVDNADAVGNGDFAWWLSSPGGNQTSLNVNGGHPIPLRFAWIVLHPSGRWSVSAHRPAGAGNVQVGGAVDAGQRWCGTKFCIVLHVHPPASFSVQRVPVRAAGTKDERAR